MAKTTDVLKILNKKYGKDPEMQVLLLQASIGSQLAQWVYDVRIRAGLTQKQLAELVGTSQPAIARLEDSDYTGHSLKVVTKIACALGESLQITVDPRRRRGRRLTVAPKRRRSPRSARVESTRRP